MDKTVSRTSYDEHMSLFWVLNYNRFVKSNKKSYKSSEDYWGFFPVNRPQFKIKDLALYSEEQIDSISDYYEMFFYTDAYGVYSNEWLMKGDINERSSLIYGGVNFSELSLMERMFQQRKLLLGEFNIVSSPTPYDVRRALEDLFQFRYTGWVLRYYFELDTAKNRDIPKWMIRLHNESQRKMWDYKGPGLVYVNEGGIVFVLKKTDELISEIPVINTKKKYTEYFNVPEFLRYPFWQDVVIPYDDKNVIAYYKVHPNERGDSILNYYKIPKVYPAVIGDSAEGLRYYFCGDFSDNPFGYLTSYFKGITYIRKLFYNNQDLSDRRKFFWEYYQPMLTRIINDYYFKKDRLDRSALRPLPKRVRVIGRTGIIPDLNNDSVNSTLKATAIETIPSPIPYGQRKSDRLKSYIESISKSGQKETDVLRFEEEDSDASTNTLVQPVKPTSENKRTASPSGSSSKQSEPSQKDQTPSTPAEESKSSVAQKSSQTDASDRTKKTEPRSLPTIQPPKEKTTEPPVESGKPFVSQKAFIDRLVVLTKSGVFVSGREYFQTEDQQQNAGKIAVTRPAALPGVTATPSKTRGWKLIIASFTSAENAKAFVSGNENFEIVNLPGTPYYRIAIKTYPTLKDAKTDIASVKQNYPDAWLLRI